MGENLSNLLNKAKSHASENGKLVGRVTRYRDIIINDSEYIGIDVDFNSYVDADIKRGQYLAIRSIIRPVIILGQVYSISRSDVLARMGIQEVSYQEDPSTIMTPAYVEIKPIAEAEYSLEDEKWSLKKIRPAVSPVDPQSPVFIPNPTLIKNLLSIPSSGVSIGKIYSGGDTIDAVVKLDEEALTHHILVIGTTGSGKTTLLKNIITNPTRKKTLVFDRQGDFVYHLMKKKEKFAVVMPVIYEKDTHKISVKDHAEEFANWYGCNSVDVVKRGAEVLCGNSKVFVVPYSINFYSNIEEFDKITPYFTSRASMYWGSIIEKTFEKIEKALDEAAEFIGGDQKKKEDITNYVFNNIMRDHLTPGKLIDSLYVNLDDLANTLNLNLSKISSTSRKIFPSTNNTEPIVVIDSKNNRRTMYINTGTAFRSAIKDLEIYHTTKDVIVRVLKAYERYGIFSVPGTYDFLPGEVFSDYDDAIVDLTWVMNKSASVEAVATVAYKILDDFFWWKDSQYQQTHKGGDLTLIIMDEAHEYFPQTNREDVAKDVVEGLINRIMRLGRVRNIGVILATHVPDDLNPLVVQLTNTKVVMRNDEHVLNSLGMEKFKDFLKYAQPGMAIVNSLRFKEVPIVTLLDGEDEGT